ncbi:MAG: DNA-binding protein [Chloroflexi bacterium]|jgi:predicted DNA-binding protein with PD1-like motif|nr:DNA-binding protein [Chloroflexota bacterium]
MRVELLQENGERTYVVVLDKGEEFVSSIEQFAREYSLKGSHFTAIGAFQDVVLGFYDMERQDFKRIPITEQVEVLSLIGNIAISHREPKLHAHVVVGKSDGTAHGGHVLEAHAWPTLEVIVDEEPGRLQRHVDEETRLALLTIP